mmetsp:Transcript_10453/g.13547  ORF Transcript_10453/g.13547 Transcript_10453/m.13547 type:complete len:321 (-) Transcript_10453:152-1114(-)
MSETDIVHLDLGTPFLALETPLFRAIHSTNSNEKLKDELKKRSTKSYLLQQNKEGNNVFHHAVLCGQVEASKILLTSVDSDPVFFLVKNSSECNLLQLAALSNQYEMAKLICESAPKAVIEEMINSNIGKSGNTPIHWAIINGNVLMATLFLEHNAKVDIPNAQGQTPPFKATEYHEPEILDMIIEKYPLVLDMSNSSGRKIIHEVMEMDSIQCIRVMFKHEPQKEKIFHTHHHDSIFRLALHYGRKDVIEFLFEQYDGGYIPETCKKDVEELMGRFYVLKYNFGNFVQRHLLCQSNSKDFSNEENKPTDVEEEQNAIYS